MSRWVRAGRCLAAIVLAMLIVGPLIPGPHAGPLNDAQRGISLQQSWRMYTPDAQRAQSYISVRAELADGSVVPLEEAIEAEVGWGTVLDWQKRRVDIWRGYLAMGDKPNANRSWYLRSLCVREDRARGAAPVKVIAERVRRALNPPSAVAAGAPTLAVLTRTTVATIDCRATPQRNMIAADRARRGLPAPEPPPMRTPQPRKPKKASG